MRLDQDRGALGAGVLDALVDVGHLEGEVDHAVAVGAVVVEDRAVGGDAAGEDEAGRARAQHVGLGVAAAGLRAAVGLELHAERELVEVRGLGGVADHEADRVHRGDRERVAAGVVLDQPDQLLQLLEGEAGLLLLVGEDGERRVHGGVGHAPPCRDLATCATVRRNTGHIAQRRWPTMDDLDGRLIALFAHEPRIGVLEASRRLDVARGTVQARLDKLTAAGVITGWGPELSAEALGYPVTAFLTLEIRQGAGPRHRRRATWRPSPRCSRRSRSPAPATCGRGWSRAPTPTCSGSSTWC